MIYPSGDILGSFTTPADGTITIPITTFGNYTVTELTAPKYHLLPEVRTQNVTCRAEETATLTFWNAPYGRIRVEKISDTGDPLQGITIQIKNLDTGETLSGKTEPGGALEFDQLAPGGYEVREIAGIEGYELDPDDVKTITVVTGEVSTVQFVNKELPGLKIIKYDRTTLQTMKDVSFEIWKDGKLLGEYKTDQLGEIVLTNLKPGTYLVKEVQGPDTHLTDSTPQQIELAAGDGVRELVFYDDQKPGMRLVKVDSSDLNKTIAGAKFRIEAVDGSYGPAEFTTDANGEIDLSKLPVGAYVVTELECPGYWIDEAQRIIQLDGNETAEFVFTNSKLPTMFICKRDADTGEVIADTVFTIRAADGHSVDEIKTGADGKAELKDLLPGVYEISEKSVPDDWLLDAPSQLVTLYPGRDHTVYFENHKKPTLTIHKVSSVTGNPLECYLRLQQDCHRRDQRPWRLLHRRGRPVYADPPRRRLVQGDGAGNR